MSEPKLTTTLDEPLKQAREWRENGSPPEPFYAVGHLIDAMADRIEELEAKLANEWGEDCKYYWPREDRR